MDKRGRWMRWEEASGVRYAFLDREKIPWSKKLNLLWWFGNDSEQTVYQADWYHPGWTQWRRKLTWNLRKPSQNFRAYVIGVQDRNYRLCVLHGNPDPMVVQRNDVNETGFQVTKLILESGLQLPFASYSGKHVVWYAGWQPSGFFGFKFNLHKEVVPLTRPKCPRASDFPTTFVGGERGAV